MEVDVEAQLFPGLQDGAGGVQVEHPLLAEHVDVVDPERPGGHQLLQPRQLDLQDVPRGLLRRLPSETADGALGPSARAPRKATVRTWGRRERRSRSGRC